MNSSTGECFLPETTFQPDLASGRNIGIRVASRDQMQVQGPFTSKLPNFSNFKGLSGTQGGYPNPNPTGLYTFGESYTDPLLGFMAAVGMYYSANLTQDPGGPHGQFQFVQTVNMGRTRSAPSQTLKMPWPVNSPTQYLTSGMDTIYPVFPTPAEEMNGYFPSGMTYYGNDSPLETFDASFTSYSANDSFVTTLLYLPTGSASMNVPIENWTWSWNCSGTFSGGIWTAPDSPMPMVAAAAAYGNFPIWTNYINASSCTWINN